jgi:hypothetical protein
VVHGSQATIEVRRRARRPCIRAGKGRPQVAHTGESTGADVHDQATAAARRQHQGVDGVVDEQEVAALSPVAVQHRQFASGERRSEGGHHPAVGSLARPVHRCHRQCGELDLVHGPVTGEQVGDSAHHHPERTQRHPGVSFLHRQVACGHLAVQRPGGQCHHDLGNATQPGCLEHGERALHRPGEIGRLAAAGRRPAEMDDHLRTAQGYQRCELVGAGIEMVDLQLATDATCSGEVGQ